MLITIIGTIGAVLTTVSFLPQAIKTIKTHDTESISFFMYLMFSIGVILWMIYGIGTGQMQITIANAITAIFALIILGFKINGMIQKKGKGKRA